MKSQANKRILVLVAALALAASATMAAEGPGKASRRGAPSEAVKACQDKEEGAVVNFTPRKPDQLEGVCTSVNGKLVAVPEGGPGPMGGFSNKQMERMTRELGLSEEQKGKIKALHQEEREKNAPLVKKLAENRERLHQAARADSFDESAVRAIAAEQAATQTELMVSRARVIHQVHKLLTPEQKAKAEKIMQKRGKRAGHGPWSMPEY